jgi:hypothetical protein
MCIATMKMQQDRSLQHNVTRVHDHLKSDQMWEWKIGSQST